MDLLNFMFIDNRHFWGCTLLILIAAVMVIRMMQLIFAPLASTPVEVSVDNSRKVEKNFSIDPDEFEESDSDSDDKSE